MGIATGERAYFSISAGVRGFSLDPNKGHQAIRQLIETYGIQPLRLSRTSVGLSRSDIKILSKALNRPFDESLAYPPA
jgi:hypothetical protein